MKRNSYPTDLTDAQWRWISPWVPPPKPGGRPAKYSRREIINAILYITRNGCTWRALPHDLPQDRIVFHYFRLWQQDGTWELIHAKLRERMRRDAGKTPKPSAAVLDSQSVKTTEQGGPRGYDAGKRGPATAGNRQKRRDSAARRAAVGSRDFPRLRHPLAASERDSLPHADENARPQALLRQIQRLFGDKGYWAVVEVCGFNDWLLALLPQHGRQAPRPALQAKNRPPRRGPAQRTAVGQSTKGLVRGAAGNAKERLRPNSLPGPQPTTTTPTGNDELPTTENPPKKTNPRSSARGPRKK